MKQFLKDNLSGMTFTFTSIVLLNTVVNLFKDGQVQWNPYNKFITVITLLILILWGVTYFISQFEFKTTRQYHLINLSTQLLIFFLIVSGLGLIPLTPQGIITNTLVYLLLYILNGRIERSRMIRLANIINQQLAKNN